MCGNPPRSIDLVQLVTILARGQSRRCDMPDTGTELRTVTALQDVRDMLARGRPTGIVAGTMRGDSLER
jgi:hypothetical protein